MPKPTIDAVFMEEQVITGSSDESRELYNSSRYGTLQKDGKLQLSLHETAHLIEKGRLDLKDGRGRLIGLETFIKKAQRLEPGFLTRYSVFRDMRDRGYVVKTALKFGADFRVYPRGKKPGEDHAKWILYPVSERSAMTWYDFAAKNRVAHSTKKKLLIGVVDNENDVTYYEIRWTRP